VQPHEAGLLDDGHLRRVAGLRREEVAQLANISVDYLARLDQGRLTSVSAGVLHALADALGLSTDAREYLVAIAGDAGAKGSRPATHRVRPQTQQLLDSMSNVPAILLGRKLDVLAWNRMGAALLADFNAIGDVEVRWSRDLPADPASVTVIKDAAGRYFASFVVQADPAADAARFPASAAEVGVDLGLTWFAVLSDGTVIRSPRFLRRAERKLRRRQKALSRTAAGSSNREKARAAVARAHAKAADSRRDFHHQVSTAVIRDNQAVYAENLCVAGLARTRLAKSIHDAGWSAFTAMLEYKAKRYGRHFGKIGRFVPSTGPCSACGISEGRKPLHVRRWTCPACGTVHDRDLNAAKNILAAGLADRLNACGGGVRPPLAVAAVSETGTLRGAA